MAVLALLVPAPTSGPASSRATDSSRWDRSRATAHPPTPPPTTATSYAAASVLALIDPSSLPPRAARRPTVRPPRRPRFAARTPHLGATRRPRPGPVRRRWRPDRRRRRRRGPSHAGRGRPRSVPATDRLEFAARGGRGASRRRLPAASAAGRDPGRAPGGATPPG